jgi:glycosidase
MNHPLLYQINTRVFLHERGAALGRRATLDDIPDEFLDEVAARGFQWIWLLGVWQTGEVGRRISREDPVLRASYAEQLPDFTDDDIVGSPFAVQSYTVNADFGGDMALARLRSHMADRGLRLLLDFVVNHTAPDHSWVSEHPEYYVRGTEEDLAREPRNYGRFQVNGNPVVFAYGRDPYFPGWPDTLQLNYRHEGCRRAMSGELLSIAQRCDGVRCDMAMLVQPQIFSRTWGDRALPTDGTQPLDTPFWRMAIANVKQIYPDFLFIAEVYWDMEWELQQEGFDYTYDKRLYDRLHAGQRRSVYEHLLAGQDFQERSLHFLENHDKPRAAAAFAPVMHPAAAVITFLVPGMRFFHEGQFEGRQVHASVHLRRRQAEPVAHELQGFYLWMLECLRRPEAHDGQWQLWELRPAWEGNSTWEQFIVCSWELGGRLLLATVNYGTTQGQCYARLSTPTLANRQVVLDDLLGEVRYERDGNELHDLGLYLDMPAYGYHLFEVNDPEDGIARLE